VQLQPIRPDPKRDADAAKLAADAGQWMTVTLTEPWGAFPVGSVFYGVPSRSRPNVYHLANGVACRCEDYQKNSAMCAHIRAVRIFLAQQEQEGSADADPTPAPTSLKSYRDLFPGCVAGCGELVERRNESCHRCTSEQVYRLDQARQRDLTAQRSS
jgi:hypothetical protein